jgi:hypothetical protein
VKELKWAREREMENSDLIHRLVYASGYLMVKGINV